MATLNAFSISKAVAGAKPSTSSFLPSVSFSPSFQNSKASRKLTISSAKRMYDDPFDYGEDPDLQFGSLLSEGRQSATIPKPPRDETSPEGYLKFPSGYNPEIASLGLYIRGDVRSCAIFVVGGVYENLLFFPVIQLLKEKYPGVEIDVIASARGKQVYELNKNVRRAWVYDVEDVLVVPADFADMLGKIKVTHLSPFLCPI